MHEDHTFGAVTAAVLLVAVPVLAQESQQEVTPTGAHDASGHHDMSAHDAMAQAASPYAGEQDRALKALSEDERRQLLAGHGMGLAKAAELNHYPGPMHVLELAEELDLSTEQQTSTQAIFDTMRFDAIALGQQVVEAEAHLDGLFAHAKADEVSLAEAVARVGRLRAELRLTHLRAHLEMRQLLTGEQIAAYDRLRGYVAADG